MWNCKNCHETIEDNLDVCWNCGTGKDGTPDPNFGRVDPPVTNHERLAAASRLGTRSGCLHCGKPIESGRRDSVPWWRYDPGRPTVGCGTLIIIAIIVSIFSRSKDASDQIRSLRSDVRNLDKKMDALQISIRRFATPEAVTER